MSSIDELTFEEAFTKLEETVQQLEEGGLSLEQSLALFEEGQALATYCNQQLEEAELKVETLSAA